MGFEVPSFGLLCGSWGCGHSGKEKGTKTAGPSFQRVRTDEEALMQRASIAHLVCSSVIAPSLELRRPFFISLQFTNGEKRPEEGKLCVYLEAPPVNKRRALEPVTDRHRTTMHR